MDNGELNQWPHEKLEERGWSQSEAARRAIAALVERIDFTPPDDLTIVYRSF